MIVVKLFLKCMGTKIAMCFNFLAVIERAWFWKAFYSV